LAHVYDLVRQTNNFLETHHRPAQGTLRSTSAELIGMCRSLGLLLDYTPSHIDPEVRKLLMVILDVRAELRRNGLFEMADRIRQKLADVGLVVEDAAEGVRIRAAR